MIATLICSRVNIRFFSKECFFSCFLLHKQKRLFQGWRCHCAWECKLWWNLYKMPWSSNRCWMTSLKKSKDLTIELEVKYLSSTSSWGTNVYIYQLPEGLRMRKILSQMVVGCKRIHKPGLTFCVFLQIFSYAGPKSTYTRAQVFYQWCR